MKLTLKLATLLLLFLGALPAKAQNVEGVNPPKDKKKIELRPNSRDYGPVRRDNFNQRIDRTRDKNLFIKKRPVTNQKFIKPGNKKEINKDRQMQRRQRVIRRRALNR